MKLRNVFLLIAIVIAMSLVFVPAASAQGVALPLAFAVQTSPPAPISPVDMPLNDLQLYVISIVAMALVYILALIAKRFNWYPQRGWLTAFLYAAAAGLAFMWSAFKLPPFPAFADPLTFVAAAFAYLNILLTELGPVVALATLIYNVLGKRVLNGIGVKVLEAIDK